MEGVSCHYNDETRLTIMKLVDNAKKFLASDEGQKMESSFREFSPARYHMLFTSLTLLQRT
jgi:hypothetical protein